MLLFTSAFAVLVGASSSSSSKTSTAGSISSLLFIVLLGVLAYVFFIRPRSQQARRQRETLQELSPGDEVLTGAGIFGRVLDVEPDRVTVETAPGTRITVLRSTIARRITEPAPEETAWTERDDEAWSQHDEAIGPGETRDTPDEGEAGGPDDETAGDSGDAIDKDDGAGNGRHEASGPGPAADGAKLEQHENEQSGGSAAGGEGGSR